MKTAHVWNARDYVLILQRFMKITEQIQHTFSRVFTRGARLPKGYKVSFDMHMSCLPFADTIFLNCVELLTDLANDVEFVNRGQKDGLFLAFKSFFNTWGKVVLNRVFTDGYVVIGHTSAGEGANASHHFRICNKNEVRKVETPEETVFVSCVEGMEVYVMRSATYISEGKSDKSALFPFLQFLDNVLNASNTVSSRLGALVVTSPKNITNAPAPFVLREEDKKALEKEISENYGALGRQSQIMVLPREMSFQVISLAQLDIKTADKARLAILAIADRIKVPANQIGIIDATSSKSLANGTELREGDFNKYQSFERLLNQTFVQMAKDMGLAVDYTIYNKPIRQTASI